MAANPLVEHLVEGSAAVGHLGPRVSQQHLPELLAHRLDLRRLFDSQRGLLRRDLSLRRQWIGERRCRHQSGSAHEQHAKGERETYTAEKRPTEWRIDRKSTRLNSSN